MAVLRIEVGNSSASNAPKPERRACRGRGTVRGTDQGMKGPPPLGPRPQWGGDVNGEPAHQAAFLFQLPLQFRLPLPLGGEELERGKNAVPAKAATLGQS